MVSGIMGRHQLTYVLYASLLSPNFYTAFPPGFDLRATGHLVLVKSQVEHRVFGPDPSPSMVRMMHGECEANGQCEVRG